MLIEVAVMIGLWVRLFPVFSSIKSMNPNFFSKRMSSLTVLKSRFKNLARA